MEGKRLFIGVRVEANNEVRDLLGFLRELDSTKVVAEENLHVNLKFLGDVEEERLSLCLEALKELEGFGGFRISLNGVGAFPSEDYIKVIWIGVDSDKLMDLGTRLEEELVMRGFKPKKKDYKPHLTVARVKRRPKPKMKEVFEEGFNRHYIDINVERVELIESKLTPEGPVYETIESVRL